MQHFMDIQQNYRNYYLTILRCISCILIVTVHVSANAWDLVSSRSFEWQTMNAYDCLGMLGVPLFVMISGTLMLDENYRLPLPKLFQKILHLFIIYHIWLFMYNLYDYFMNNTIFQFASFKKEVLFETLMGEGIYHLWFLPMLIGLYLATPVFRQIVKSKETSFYFLVVYFIIKIIFSTLLPYNFPFSTIVSSMYGRIAIVLFTEYSGYYVLGHYLHHHVTITSHKSRILLGMIAFFSMALAIFLCGYDGYLKNEPSTITNSPYTIMAFISCTCIFLLCKSLIKNNKESKALLFYSSSTLGIYILHPFFLKIMNEFGLTPLILPPIISIPLFVIGAVLCCGGVAWIISKIPMVKYSI